MPDEPTPTVWDMDPHTKAKHELLRAYLKRWLPIIGAKSPSINYLDGFAGPGMYSGGEDGSPVVAIDTCSTHARRPERVFFGFVEKDAKRAQILTTVLASRFPSGSLPPLWTYAVENQEFAGYLDRILNGIEGRGARISPTFAFLDPFGFGGIPLRSISRLLAYPRCETLVTLMSSFVSRFLEEDRAETLTNLFGCEDWRTARNLHGERRLGFLLRLYEHQLHQVAGAKHVLSFTMESHLGVPLYHLVFATKHSKGFREMKEAMTEVDRRGTYRFSDRTDPGQTYLFDFANDASPVWVDRAADAVQSRFGGMTIRRKLVEEFIWYETKFPFRASILKVLRERRAITVIGEERPRSFFPTNCELSFAPSDKEEGAGTPRTSGHPKGDHTGASGPPPIA